MKKELQLQENKKVLECLDAVKQETNNYMHLGKSVALRSCKAEVYTTPNYYLLRSYGTIVACIARNTGECFDFLRYVYGYTATSAQHIAKFKSDYGFHRDIESGFYSPYCNIVHTFKYV